VLLHIDYLGWGPRKKWSQRRSGPGKRVKILTGGKILEVGKYPVFFVTVKKKDAFHDISLCSIIL